MCKRNDFTKDGNPRNWRGQKSKIEELGSKLIEMENEMQLVKESYSKEIDRLKLAVSDHVKTIRKQAEEITKLRGAKFSAESENEALLERYGAMMRRSLWDRICNKEVEP